MSLMIIIVLVCANSARSADGNGNSLEQVLPAAGGATESLADLLAEYVVAADFNNRPVAQLQIVSNVGIKEQKRQPEIVGPDDTISSHSEQGLGLEEKIGKHDSDGFPNSNIGLPSSSQYLMDYDQPAADERYHPISTPIQAASYGPVASERSVMAIGFITFLLLLTSLQNNMMNAIQTRPQSQSLLGGVTQAIGRRRRSLSKAYLAYRPNEETSHLH